MAKVTVLCSRYRKKKLTDMQCLPDSLQGRKYYRPQERAASCGPGAVAPKWKNGR